MEKLSTIIYNFLIDTLIDTSIPGAENLAVLLTWTFIVLFFFAIFKLSVWMFSLIGVFFNGTKYRD